MLSVRQECFASHGWFCQKIKGRDQRVPLRNDSKKLLDLLPSCVRSLRRRDDRQRRLQSKIQHGL